VKAGEQIKQTTERLGGYISQPSDTGTATAEKQAAPTLPRYGGLRP